MFICGKYYLSIYIYTWVGGYEFLVTVKVGLQLIACIAYV